MQTTVLSRKAIKEISIQTHQVIFNTFAKLFEEDHTRQQTHYRNSGDSGFSIVHGYKKDFDTVIPVCEIVVGARIHNKHSLPAISVLGINRLLKQTFPNKKAWASESKFVDTKKIVEGIANLVAANSKHLEVFAGIYQNKFTYSNVFGLVVLLKDVVGEQRLSFELTIDDIDLVEASEINRLFI